MECCGKFNIYGHLELTLFLIAIFTGNHWSSLVFRNRSGTSIVLHNIEVVMQGGALAMITLGIGILPLIKTPKTEFPDVTRPWYVDNSIALGAFARVKAYFYSL